MPNKLFHHQYIPHAFIPIAMVLFIVPHQPLSSEPNHDPNFMMVPCKTNLAFIPLVRKMKEIEM